jgi:hypothetical protein
MNSSSTKPGIVVPVGDARAAARVLAKHFDLVDLVGAWPAGKPVRTSSRRSEKVPVPAPSTASRKGGTGKPVTWSARGSKGPVPGWVLKDTGAKNKHQVAMLFDPDAIFTKGGKVPPRVGE